MLWNSLKRMEIFHAKQHFDGIQHLVPLIRVIVKKFHHIFLGTYQVSLSEGHDDVRSGSHKI